MRQTREKKKERTSSEETITIKISKEIVSVGLLYQVVLLGEVCRSNSQYCSTNGHYFEIFPYFENGLRPHFCSEGSVNNKYLNIHYRKRFVLYESNVLCALGQDQTRTVSWHLFILIYVPQPELHYR